MKIRPVAFTHADVVALVERVQAEYVRRYGSPDDTPLTPQLFTAPLGAFYVGYLDGRPVAMGGWSRREDVAAFGRTRPAEVKRMYVVEAARRAGFASAMLAHLESAARAAGADLMVLETGTPQPEALAMYAGAGYRPVPRFGHYAESSRSRHLGKPL